VVVYRIVNVKHKDSALSGVGAEMVGGRWNEVGMRAVYCSENISLALLEYYVHSENIEYLPKEIVVARIEFPDDFVVEELKDIPEDGMPIHTSPLQLQFLQILLMGEIYLPCEYHLPLLD
jgi:hypothetical protein